MPESDVTKMKVADLKRELKIRGLATTGNKTELQDRLQTALIDSELSLEDTAISGEDLLDDSILTDEEDSKILDENELLTSPSRVPADTTPTVLPGNAGAPASAVAGSSAATGTVTKKVILKRKISVNVSGVAEPAAATTAAPANKEVAEPKAIKLSESNGGPATTGASDSTKASGESTIASTNKIKQLSAKERLELRAKKFGLDTAAVSSTATSAVSSNPVAESKQIELMKKRAERFGCVVSPHMAKLDVDEKLKKRQERFANTGSVSSGTTTTTAVSSTPSSASTDVWAEKARKRLERFKTAPGDHTATTSITTTTTSG